MQDHKVILRALDVLDQMAKRVEDQQPLEHEDVETILRFLRFFADEYHQGKEESALFPQVRQAAGSQDGPLRHMLFEHDQERSLVEGIEDALHTKNGLQFVHFSRRLIELMRDHVRKEDMILFRIIGDLLSAQQDDTVVAELGKFDIDPGYLSDLRDLERKYMRKGQAA
ncbi:MAG TPA: hemerythrin domain-containing protein [Terriglobia bacterium]|nr:hemerythrin domain-containing protein [Terriglobia bacterium]